MKITVSGLIDSITQTSGGTTIQNSYGGLQLHGKAYQKRKKSINQQNTRQAFTNVQSSWGALDPTQHDTWNAAADPGKSGFELYSSTNNIVVGAGAAIIQEYTTPVTPPTNDLEYSTELYDFDTFPKRYTGVFDSPGSNLPASGWLPYIRWSGWITMGQYRYPPTKFVIPQSAIISFDTDHITFGVNQTMNSSFRNFVIGCKAQFIIGILNTTTGQIEELLTHNAINMG